MLFLEPSAAQLHCFIFKMWLEMTVIRGRGHSLCSVEGDEYIHLTCMEYNLRCKGLCWVLLEKIKLLTTKTAKNYLPWNFIKDFIYLFLDRREAREKERERGKHQCVVASHALPTRDLAGNPGMCPDWESNQQPFGLQAGTQSTEPHQLGPFFEIFDINLKVVTLPQSHIFLNRFHFLCFSFPLSLTVLTKLFRF